MPLLASLVKLADRITGSDSTRFGANHTILKRYGKMTHLTIDPKTKSIDLDLELLGESAPIHIHVDRYQFERLPTHDARLTAQGITISRPWLQELAKNFAESKPLLIPQDLAGYLAMVL